MYKSDLLNSKEVLVIPPNVGNLETVQLILPIYNVDIDGVVRSFLMVVPSQQNRSRASFHQSNRFMHLSLRLMRPNSTKGDIASGLPSSFTHIRICLCQT